MTARGRAIPAGAFLGILLAGVPGCSYLSARGRDATDLISLGISSGSGMGVRIGATRLLAAEVMAQKDETFAGVRQRNFRWTESSYGLLFASFRMPTVGDEPPPPRWKFFDLFTTSRRRTLHPNRPEVEDRRHTLFVFSGAHAQRAVDFLDLEAGASAFIGGLEVSIRPGELADFILGWFGLDIARDDGIRYGETVPPARPAASAPGSD